MVISETEKHRQALDRHTERDRETQTDTRQAEKHRQTIDRQRNTDRQ